MAHLDALIAYARDDLDAATAEHPTADPFYFAHEIAADIALGASENAGGIPADPRVRGIVLRAAFDPNVPLPPAAAAVYLLIMEAIA